MKIELLLLSLVLVSGCSLPAKYSSIYREVDTRNKSIAVDAKQRLIFSAKQDESMKGAEGRGREVIICAEPSPDVFSTLASGTGFTGSTSTIDKEISAQFARSIAESGVDIGLRTQTIQVLRDMMFRLCERYMNGAISEYEFKQQADRDQRLIISVLAIEQLTGAVRPQRAGTTSTSSTDLGKGLLKAQESLNEGKTALSKQEELFNTENEKLAGLALAGTTAEQELTPLKASVESLKQELVAVQADSEKTKPDVDTTTTKHAETLAALNKDENTKKDPTLIAANTAAETDKKAAIAKHKINTDKETAIGTKITSAQQAVAAKDAEILEKNNEAKEAKKATEKIAGSVKDAKDNVALLQNIRDAAERGAGSAQTSVVFQQNSPAPTKIDAATAGTLSAAVVDIVKETFRDDEFQRTCTSIINGYVTKSTGVNTEIIKETNFDTESGNRSERESMTDGKADELTTNILSDCLFYLRDIGEVVAKMSLADKVNELIKSGVSADVASRLLTVGLAQ